MMPLRKRGEGSNRKTKHHQQKITRYYQYLVMPNAKPWSCQKDNKKWRK